VGEEEEEEEEDEGPCTSLPYRHPSPPSPPSPPLVLLGLQRHCSQ